MKRRLAITYAVVFSPLFLMSITGTPAYMHGNMLLASMIVGGIVTGLVWATWTLDVVPREMPYKQQDQQQADTREKRKRDRLDAVLRDLSNDELHRLRQRLSDGTVDDDDLYDRMTIGDDGELIHKER